LAVGKKKEVGNRQLAKKMKLAISSWQLAVGKKKKAN